MCTGTPRPSGGRSPNTSTGACSRGGGRSTRTRTTSSSIAASRARASSDLRDEPDAAAGDVLRLPAEAFDLASKAIGLGEVPACPGRLAQIREAPDLGRAVGARAVDAEAEDGEAAGEEVELPGGS